MNMYSWSRLVLAVRMKSRSVIMKKVSLAIIATIVTAFFAGVFVFQPTTNAASDNGGSATPSQEGARRVPKRMPKSISVPDAYGNDLGQIRRRDGGDNSSDHRSPKVRAAKPKFKPKKPVSWRAGQDIVGEAERRKHPRKRNSQRRIRRNRTETVDKNETITVRRKRKRS